MLSSKELAKHFDLCQHNIEGRHDGYHGSDYLSSKYFERYFTGDMPISKKFIMKNFSHIKMTSVVKYDEGMVIGKVINGEYEAVIYSWRGAYYVSPMLTLKANISKLDLSGLEKIELKEIK